MTTELEDGRTSVSCRREGEEVVQELPQRGRKEQTSTIPWQLPKVHRGSSSPRRSHSTAKKRRPNQHRRYRLLKSTSSHRFNLTTHGKKQQTRKATAKVTTAKKNSAPASVKKKTSTNH